MCSGHYQCIARKRDVVELARMNVQNEFQMRLSLMVPKMTFSSNCNLHNPYVCI